MTSVTSAVNSNMSDFRESIITSDQTICFSHVDITINQKPFIAKSFSSKAPAFKLTYSNWGVLYKLLVATDRVDFQAQSF
jgi:hypothetical protein